MTWWEFVVVVGPYSKFIHCSELRCLELVRITISASDQISIHRYIYAFELYKCLYLYVCELTFAHNAIKQCWFSNFENVVSLRDSSVFKSNPNARWSVKRIDFIAICISSGEWQQEGTLCYTYHIHRISKISEIEECLWHRFKTMKRT